MNLELIEKKLNEKAKKPCVRCGKFAFTVLTSEYSITNEDKEIKVIIVGCNYCGALAFHEPNKLMED